MLNDLLYFNSYDHFDLNCDTTFAGSTRVHYAFLRALSFSYRMYSKVTSIFYNSSCGILLRSIASVNEQPIQHFGLLILIISKVILIIFGGNERVLTINEICVYLTLTLKESEIDPSFIQAAS